MHTTPGVTPVRPVHSRGRWSARAALAASGAAALVLAAAGGAMAHVTVHSADAKPGGSDATLVFKVPNEEPNAGTTKIEIDLPTDTPMVGVTAQAPSGWTAEVTSTQIVFSGGSITGDNDQEFPVKVGKLPSLDKIVFKTVQTYSNGDAVRWIEQVADGAAKPAHPAPTLDLNNPNKVDQDDAGDHAAASGSAGHANGMSGTDMSGMNMSGMNMNKMSMASIDSASTAAPSSTSSDSYSSGSSSTSSPSPSNSSSSSDSTTPKSVQAGTGGQAAGGHGVPVAPLPFVLAGLAAAAYGVRRLIRG